MSRRNVPDINLCESNRTEKVLEALNVKNLKDGNEDVLATEKVSISPINEEIIEEVAVKVNNVEGIDVILDNESAQVEKVVEMDIKTDEVVVSKGESKVNGKTNIQKVNATVEFTSLHHKLSEADVDGLLHILRSKDHLHRNVKSVDEGTLTSRNRDDCVVHSLAVVLDVEAAY